MSRKPERGWQLTWRHVEMRAAARAGLLPPSRWDGLSAEDKAEVLEWDLAERLMEQYEHDHPPPPPKERGRR